MDHTARTLDEYLEDWRTVSGNGGVFRAFIGYSNADKVDICPTIIFSPELLRFASDNKLDRAAFQKRFWEKTSLPLKWVSGLREDQKKLFAKTYNLTLTPDTMIPKAMAPENFNFVVSGGAWASMPMRSLPSAVTPAG